MTKFVDVSKRRLIRPISYLIFLGYVVLSIITIIIIQKIEFARNLFDSTKPIILINAVWFALSISFYGIYALYKNRKRALLSNLDIQLDTQFLIVSAFILFALKQIIDLYLYLNEGLSDNVVLAWENGGKVLEFGGFMSGFTSIFFGKKRK